MGDQAMEQNRYDSYLQSALAMASNEQSLGEQIVGQVSEYKSGLTQSGELGTELSLTSLPALIPTAKDTYEKANKLYKSFQEIKSQGSKVIDAIQTIPADVAKLYGSKVGQLKSLVNENTAESLAKAKGLYGDLQKTVSESAKSGKSILNTTTSQLKDISSNTLENATNLVNESSKSGKSLLDTTTTQLKDISSNTLENVQSGVSNMSNLANTANKNIAEQLSNTTNEVVNNVVNKAQNVSQELARLGIPNIAPEDDIFSPSYRLTTTPIETLVTKRPTALGLADTISSRAELGQVRNLKRQIFQAQPIEMPNVIGSAKVGVNKVTGQINTQLNQGMQSAEALANDTKNQASTLLNQTKSQAEGLLNQTTTQAQELANTTATQAKTALTEGTQSAQNLASSTINDLTNTGNEAKNLLTTGAEKVASVFEKTSLGDLPELIGVSSLPIVGEALGLAGLVGGAIEGVKDMFSKGGPAPVVALPVQAGIVHQAGI